VTPANNCSRHCQDDHDLQEQSKFKAQDISRLRVFSLSLSNFDVNGELNASISLPLEEPLTA